MRPRDVDAQRAYTCKFRLRSERSSARAALTGPTTVTMGRTWDDGVMPADARLVDATDIIRLVGPLPFSRAHDILRRSGVLEVDMTEVRLTARVLGTQPVPYSCTVWFEHGRPTSSACSCPVGADCKHVAAALLAANESAALARGATGTGARGTLPGTSAGKDWRATLGALAQPREVAPVTPLGLLLELRQQTAVARGGWGAPTARAATALIPGAAYRLAARPVSLSPTGNWVRAPITWSSIGYQVNRLGLSAEQAAWFTQFAALHRSSREPAGFHEPDWLALDDAGSPLLWPLLEHGRALGIALVSGKRATDVSIAAGASVGLNAVRGSSGLELRPRVEIDGEAVPVGTADAASVGLIGDHGVYAAALDPPRFVLAPLERRLQPQLRELVLAAQPIEVPAGDADEFLSEVYPRLHETVDISSPDASVELPAILPPVLVFTVEVGDRDALTLRWEWERGRVRETAEGRGPTGTLGGADAAAFVVDELPRIRSREDVRVEIVGDLPPYTALLEKPTLTVTTVPSEHRDWFDLGVLVHVGEREVPFSQIFSALSKGRSKVLLPDKSYLSLDQPVFDELKRLLDEAAELGEWEPRPRIARHQAALWWELEELAEATEQATAWRAAIEGLRTATETDASPLPRGLAAELRPYQHEGFAWLTTLWRHGLGGVLADDMGLGKTLQTIALLLHVVENRAEKDAAGDGTVGRGTPDGPGRDDQAAAPFLIVAPTSVVPNWVAELARFAPSLRVHTITGTRAPLPAPDAVDVVVTSYSLFRLGAARYRERSWAGLVLDEAQFVKNPQSKAHQAAAELGAPFVLALTGTPMENSLWDLWSILRLTSPGLFASRSRFGEFYVKPIEAGSSARLEQLRGRIRPFLLRRTKALVAPELPEKQEQVLSVELAPRHRALYDRFLQKERQKLLGLIDDLDRNRFIVFRSLTLLRMLALDASLIDPAYADLPSSKLDVLVERLGDVVAEGHRALVFSQFTSYLGLVSRRLAAAGIAFEYLDGSTRGRGEVIERFRSGNAPVFLISLKAGGFGLTLTEADYVFLLDPWWNPAAESQAIDRAHRIGQTAPVFVYRMLAAGTIEDKVMALRNEKARLFDAVMDENAAFSSALTPEDIRALLA